MSGLVLATFVLLGADTGAGATPPPDLSGHWVLNEKLSEDAREKMRAAFEAATALTITHTAREIAVLDTDGRLRALHPDGEKYASASGADVKTRWDKDRLVVQTSRDRGPSLTETWRMAGEPAQLVIELRLQPPNGEAVTVKRVYDRATAAE